MKKLALTLVACITGSLLLMAQQTNFFLPKQDDEQCEQWVNHTLSRMKLKDKIGQLFVYKVEPVNDKETQKKLKHIIHTYKIGGILFDDGTLEGQANLTNYMQSLSQIPVMVTFDGEWGLSMRLDSTPDFPKNAALGCIRDNTLIEAYGKEVARELKELGVHVNFAPVADVNTNPKNPVIHVRSFGENQRQVSAKVIAYAKGLESGGVLSVSKHFPGHGDADADSHDIAPIIPFNRVRLDSVELYPFRQYINAGLGGVMVGHLKVSALEPDRQIITSISANVVDGLLKKEMGFRGLVFTDALEMKAVSYIPGVNVKALKAGNDMILIDPQKIDYVYRSIHDAIRKGELTEEEIDGKCRKVLEFKYRMGLATRPVPIALNTLSSDINSAGAKDLAAQLRTAAVTVLGNYGRVLPLQQVPGGVAVVNIGKKDANREFVDGMGRHTQVATFQIDKDTDGEARRQIAQQLGNYRRAVVCITEKDTDVHEYADFFHSLNLPSTAIVYTFFTSYRAMLPIAGALRNSSTVVLAHSAEPDLQKYVSDVLFAKASANGKLSMSVGDVFREGDGVEITPDMQPGITPEDQGMRSYILDKGIDSLVYAGLRANAFPGCQVLVLKNGIPVYNKSFGTHTHQDLTSVRPIDLYDLGSLTETTGTLLAIMKLYDEGQIKLTDKVSHYVHFLRSTNKRDITVRDLLFHEAGLHPNFRFYLDAIDDNSVHGPFMQGFVDEWHYTRVSEFSYASSDFVFKKGLVSSTPTEAHTLHVADNMWMNKSFHNTIMQRIAKSELDQKRYVYSNANFILLQQMVEAITKMPLDAYLDKEFYIPMALDRTKFLPTRYYDKKEIIPTSTNDYLRRQDLHGFVQDETAACLGGIAGNAGLFSTANEVGQIYQMLLNDGQYKGKQYLSEATCRLFTTEKSAVSHRGLGFDTPSFAPQAFGQLSYTGTSAWADPEHNFVFVFMSNRGNPNAWNDAIIQMRIRENMLKMVYEAGKE